MIIAKEEKGHQDDIISSPLKDYLNTNYVTTLRSVINYLVKNDNEPDQYKKSLKSVIVDAIIIKLPKSPTKDEIDVFINICMNDLERPVMPKIREKKNKKATDLNTPSIVKPTRKFKEVLASTPNKEETLNMMNTLVWDKKNTFPFPPKDIL